jgi:DNA polymerase III alpha subunit (gram-positive type)
MIEEEPNLVTSSKSQKVLVDGYVFSIEIYRLEGETEWTLEVVDYENSSHVWDELFKSDNDARDAALKDLESEGALAFMRTSNVIPFKS